MKQNTCVILAMVFFACSLMVSCKKEDVKEPVADKLVDGISYIGKDFNDQPAACVMLSDFSKKTILFGDIAVINHPLSAVISPDGANVLICNDPASGQYSLNSWNMASPMLSRISEFNTIMAKNPVYTSDGSKIVYINSHTSAIEIVDTDGQNRKILYTAAAGTTSSPSITPDNQKIVFQYTENNVSDIYVINMDGTNPLVVRKGDATHNYQEPWVMSNDKIIYVTLNKSILLPANSVICTAGINGENEQILVAEGKYNLPSVNKKGDALLYWNAISNKWTVSSISESRVSIISTIPGTLSNHMIFSRVDPRYISGSPTPKD